MKIQRFALDYNIIGMAFGTIIGIAITNWIREFRETIRYSEWYGKYGPDEKYGTMISATIEVVILFAVIYLVYQYIVQPIIISDLEEKEKEEKEKADTDVSKRNVINDVRKMGSTVQIID